MILMVMAIQTRVAFSRLSRHLVRPFEEWLVLYLLQNLLNRLPKYCINNLGVRRARLPNKVPPWSVIIITIRPEIPHLLRDYLGLSFPLKLIFLYPFVLLYSVHQLAHTADRFTRQGFPQVVISWKTGFESGYSHRVILPPLFR